MRLNLCVALAGMSFTAAMLLWETGAAVSQVRAPGPFSAFAPDCAIVPVDKEHLFLVAGVYQGDTLTNVQMNQEGVTTAVRITVSGNKKPVTLLLQSETPVIWDFGAGADQVKRVIVIAPKGERAAVRGLTPAQVEFFKMTRCPVQSIPLREGAARSERVLEEIFGRPADNAAYIYKADMLAIPALTFAQSKSGGGPERTAATPAEKALLNFFPGGFRLLDKDTLLSPAALSVPETYPGEAGLIQLERAGAIRPPSAEELAAFAEGFSNSFRSKADPQFLVRLGFSYAVTRDLMLPAGLFGAHSKSFLVLPGVPQPRGAPGHGCIGYLDGFRTNNGATCYGDLREPLERLKSAPSPETTACRALNVPADASVEAVSIYEPKVAKRSIGSKRNPEPVDLQVSKPGDVLLVLNTYEPAIWRVSAASGTRIVGVIMIGYRASKVEGIDAATPVLVVDHDGRASRAQPARDCEWAYRYNGTGFRGGPAAMVLSRQVELLTGKPLDGLRGAYALNSAEIR